MCGEKAYEKAYENQRTAGEFTAERADGCTAKKDGLPAKVAEAANSRPDTKK